MAFNNFFGEALTRIAASSTRLAFEVRFNQIQNTVIRRLNDKIDKLDTQDESKYVKIDLRREFNAGINALPVIQRYLLDNQSNEDRLSDMSDAVAALRDTFADDGDADNVTQDEVDSFISRRDAIVDSINELWVLTHPDFTDPFALQDLKNDVDTIAAWTPVVGVVDPEGTEPATNDNRSIYEAANTLLTKVNATHSATATTVAMTFTLEQSLQGKLADIDAQLLEVDVLAQQKKIAEINDLKAENANLLQAISISFEASQGLTTYLANGLAGKVQNEDTVMQLFA
jgi:hypothetical protein